MREQHVMSFVLAYFAMGLMFVAFDNDNGYSGNKRITVFWVGSVAAAIAGAFWL